MAEIVVGDAYDSQFFACRIDCTLAFMHLHDGFISSNANTFSLKTLQQKFHVRDHRHAPHVPILCARFGVTTNQNLTLLKITIAPGDVSGLTLTKPSER